MMKKMIVICLLCLGCNSGPQHPTERAERRFLEKYAVAAMESFQLRYIGLNVATSDKITDFGARFMINQLADIDQARFLMINSSQKFIESVNADPKLSKFLANDSFKLENLDYYVSFWDDQTDRPAKPYVALATIKNGKISYHFKCSDSDFLDESATVEESFEEALTRLK
ncbi:MAG: hypothetical protein KDK50_04625 [Chlamydiia bacterium]|nr:hypothetical protein [Chlamydiia bacterium]